jgi:hypothetical protein
MQEPTSPRNATALGKPLPPESLGEELQTGVSPQGTVQPIKNQTGWLSVPALGLVLIGVAGLAGLAYLVSRPSKVNVRKEGPPNDEWEYVPRSTRWAKGMTRAKLDALVNKGRLPATWKANGLVSTAKGRDYSALALRHQMILTILNSSRFTSMPRHPIRWKKS